MYVSCPVFFFYFCTQARSGRKKPFLAGPQPKFLVFLKNTKNGQNRVKLPIFCTFLHYHGQFWPYKVHVWCTGAQTFGANSRKRPKFGRKGQNKKHWSCPAPAPRLLSGSTSGTSRAQCSSSAAPQPPSSTPAVGASQGLMNTTARPTDTPLYAARDP